MCTRQQISLITWRSQKQSKMLLCLLGSTSKISNISLWDLLLGKYLSYSWSCSPTHLHSSNQSQADAELHHIETKHLGTEASHDGVASLKWGGHMGGPKLLKLWPLKDRESFRCYPQMAKNVKNEDIKNIFCCWYQIRTPVYWGQYWTHQFLSNYGSSSLLVVDLNIIGP